MLLVFAGLILGWAIGTNDASNAFGTAVSSRMMKFRTAAILGAIFVVIGAVTKGFYGITTLSLLSRQTMSTAAIISLSSAIAIVMMTLIKMPISTSQAVVGAIIGQSLVSGTLNTNSLYKIIICWVGTPVGACAVAIGLYYLVKVLIKKNNYSFIYLDGWLRYGFIIAGCYSAYALGANNVANVVGVYYGLNPWLTAFNLALMGGLSMALGILTFSRNVMLTVGKRLVELNSLTSLIVVVACAVTVHFFAIIGVPVSSSQAIIGALLGIGIIKKLVTLRWRMLGNILVAWIVSPCIAGCISFILIKSFI